MLLWRRRNRRHESRTVGINQQSHAGAPGPARACRCPRAGGFAGDAGFSGKTGHARAARAVRTTGEINNHEKLFLIYIFAEVFKYSKQK